jgi:hypothetical protein
MLDDILSDQHQVESMVQETKASDQPADHSIMRACDWPLQSSTRIYVRASPAVPSTTIVKLFDLITNGAYR